jgi:hypothetical protein
MRTAAGTTKRYLVYPINFLHNPNFFHTICKGKLVFLTVIDVWIGNIASDIITTKTVKPLFLMED